MTHYPQSTSGLNYKTYPVGPTATSTQITSNASANTKGSYTTIIASADFDANGVWVVLPALTAGARNWLFDIAIGGAGSEVVVIPNLMAESSTASSLRGHYAVFFPLAVAAGARVSARCQDTAGGGSLFVAVTLVAAGNTPGCAAFTAHGITTATSLGTSIDPGASVGAKGAYSQITASTAAVAQYLIYLVSSGSNATPTSYQWAVDIATGAAASEVVLIPDLRVSATDTSMGMEPKSYGAPTYIAAGTRIAMRASCNGNDATDRLFRAALYTAVAPSESSGSGVFSAPYIG